MPTKTTIHKREIPLIHPGEILFEEFLKPLKISQYRLAKDVNVPPRRINEIVLGKRAISADTALRLSLFFGNSAKFWPNLQNNYDLELRREELGARLESDVKILKLKLA
ncbi:MAG: HigA family addiction module antitoxin [Candidatus Gracilibacteria bacterium]|jgi:addiction module HigA family antidote